MAKELAIVENKTGRHPDALDPQDAVSELDSDEKRVVITDTLAITTMAWGKVSRRRGTAPRSISRVSAPAALERRHLIIVVAGGNGAASDLQCCGLLPWQRHPVLVRLSAATPLDAQEAELNQLVNCPSDGNVIDIEAVRHAVVRKRRAIAALLALPEMLPDGRQHANLYCIQAGHGRCQRVPGVILLGRDHYRTNGAAQRAGRLGGGHGDQAR
jgi:hypothetical protein